jgi:hypothetical protein
MARAANLQLPPLTRQSMMDLLAKARNMGMEPGDYAKRLIEDGLALQREAEESPFAKIMKPVRDAAGDVDDAQIMKLVETARAEHHGVSRRKKKK